jgi:molecular chaperone GrpE (heat shock protein)
MMDFEAELNKLLARESGPLPQSELAELAAAEQNLFASLNQKQTDLSLQIEEIYDLAKEADTRVLQEALETEKIRANRLAGAAVRLSDMLEDFCVYAAESGSEELAAQAVLLWKNSGALLEGCGITRLGEEGQPLDPEIHTVKAAAPSFLPREHVSRVLQSGYRYLGEVVRKAAVLVSTGTSPPNVEDVRFSSGVSGEISNDTGDAQIE